MDINKVIQLGEKIEKQDIQMDLGFEVIAGIIVLVILGVILIMAETGIGGFFLLCAIGIFGYQGFFIPMKEEVKIYNAEVEKWKNEVAYPYIESLEKEKKEIVYVKIDPELSSDVSGFMTLGTGSVQSENIEKTPIVVSYKDNGVVTRTDWVPTHMELTTEEKPFIQFQRLTKDLGHGIEAGLYNPQVYLPESYSFTEIK